MANLQDEITNGCGFSVIASAIPLNVIAQLRSRLEEAIAEENAYHQGAGHRDHGMVLVCPKYDAIFGNVFDHDPIFTGCNALLGDGCIVYAYTSSSMPPRGTNYSSRIHVDCPRVIPSYLSQIGIIIALDDFTNENGATFFLPGSQNQEKSPTEEDFWAKAIQLTMPAGSICFFHAHLWHSGGQNKTDQWRHALTINMCRSYMKQRLDFPKLLDNSIAANFSCRAVQKLGYLAQVPASYDEYYAAPANRKWKQIRD